MKLFVNLLLLFFVTLIPFSCTVQKRNYQKGYYVSFKKQRSSVDPKTENKSVQSEIRSDLYASNETKMIDIDHSSKLLIDLNVIKSSPPDSCGDNITLTNSSVITAKILEINEDAVKYKRCDNLSGPTYSERKSNIKEIIFLNGVKEYFEPISKINPNPNSCGDFMYFKSGATAKVKVLSDTGSAITYKLCERKDGKIFTVRKEAVNRIDYETEKHTQSAVNISNKDRRVNGFAIAAFVTSVCIFLPYFIALGPVFGIIALHQVKQNPNTYNYSSKGFAIAGISIGMALTAIIILGLAAWVTSSFIYLGLVLFLAYLLLYLILAAIRRKNNY